MRLGPRFGGGLSTTLIHPIVLVWMLISIVLIFFLPRKYAAIPLLICAIITPWGQELNIAGILFMVYRIVVLAGLARVLLGKFTSSQGVPGGWNPVDRAFTLCMISQAVAFTLLFMDSQALINQLGFLIDFLGAYV